MWQRPGTERCSRFLLQAPTKAPSAAPSKAPTAAPTQQGGLLTPTLNSIPTFVDPTLPTDQPGGRPMPASLLKGVTGTVANLTTGVTPALQNVTGVVLPGLAPVEYLVIG